MEATQLPYDKFLGLEIHGDGCLAPADDFRYANHLGTVHAGALFSQAEASSGPFLMEHVNAEPNAVVAVLGSAAVKYRQPGRGASYRDADALLMSWKRCRRVLRRAGGLG